ncbi:serine/threonine protein kinase [Roseovarius sp. D22-M7]|uniref:serine/threonine protein kinase n=1 Tax=Roseovarius sp. D22-M7 TaxID=3127116 RepID=UPI00300FB658
MIDGRSFLPVGAMLGEGRFKILAHAGRGGFGLTYKAHDLKRGGAPVAVKEYFPYGGAERRDDEVAFLPNTPLSARPHLSAFSEALATDRVSHPSVPNTILTFRERGTAYIVMNWIEGQTLSSLAQSGGATPDALLKTYLTGLDVALHFAAAGLAHRDLNPNNIMIDADDEPIIIDFGLARAVGPGYTTMTRTVAFAPGFEPPEQNFSKGWQDVWTDVYTLSASMYYAVTGARASRSTPGTLLEFVRRDETLVKGLSEAFAACVDQGLITDISQRLRSGQEALETLGIDRARLAEILSPEVFAVTKLLEPLRPMRYSVGEGFQPVGRPEALAPVVRYQRSLLQSFDTARFQPTSLKRRDGSELTTGLSAKVALARTEAALNLLFGREIVVPAGQIAESPAFMTIFMEIMGPFLKDYATPIAAACKNAGLPTFQPFRLALESRSMIDYEGFVREYRFTGAPLVLIRAAGGESGERDEKAAARIQGFKNLFLARDFSGLETAIGQPGYGDFARMVAEWFGPTTGVFARRDVPEVSSNEYARFFDLRLRDEELVGEGVSEARASLELVEEIETVLREADVSGYRGNWYRFAERFGEIWPLARAYLDTRLFLTLARQYEIDHPIFVTQEFEFGRFDHSLVLGPRFASNMDSDDESPLLQVASNFSEPVNWSAIMELYLDDRFLRSVRRLTRHFFDRTPASDERYVEDIESHGNLLARLLGDVLAFETSSGRLSVRPISVAGGVSMSYEAYDPLGLTEELRSKDRMATESFFVDGRLPDKELTAIKTLQTDQSGRAAFSDAAAATVLHYYAKPYRSFVSTA